MNTKGFSLFEIVVVLALVSLLANISLPRFENLLANQRAQNYLSELRVILVSARLQSGLYDRVISICPAQNNSCTSNWTNDIIVFVDNNSDLQRQTNEPILRVLSKPKENDYLYYSRKGISFRPDGTIDGLQSGHFKYCIARHLTNTSPSLVINQAGRISVRDHKPCY